MKGLLRDPWFQLFALLAIVSVGIAGYNEASCHAYSGGDCRAGAGSTNTASTPAPPPTASQSVTAQPNATSTPPDPPSAALATTPLVGAVPSLDTLSSPPSSAPPAASSTSSAAPAATAPSVPATTATAANSTATIAYKGNGYLATVAFRTANEGIAGGAAGVVRTTDGGRTWTPDAGAPASVSGMVSLPSGVSFMVSGGGIFRSGGPGTGWTQMRTDAKWGLNAIAFASPDVGVAVGACGELVRTADAGRSWQHVNVAVPPVPDSSFGCDGSKKVTLSGVAFSDAQIGVVTGMSGALLRTADGGLTWDPVPVSNNFQLAAVTGLKKDQFLAVGQDSTKLGRALLLRSDDGGRSWNPTPACSARGVIAVAFNQDIGLIGSRSGIVCVSRNGGRTWADLHSANAAVMSVAIVSPTEGVALLGDGTILRLTL